MDYRRVRAEEEDQQERRRRITEQLHVPEHVETVRSELNINLIEDNISMIDLRFVSESPEHHPILDALACKLGYSLTIITPPTELCLLCDQRITRRNPNRNPTQVSLFTLTGPKIASKLT